MIVLQGRRRVLQRRTGHGVSGSIDVLLGAPIVPLDEGDEEDSDGALRTGTELQTLSSYNLALATLKNFFMIFRALGL